MYVFGYGSLMWNPNFNYLEKRDFVLENYKRDFCLKTNYHRGCIKQFGIVLGLKYSKNDFCKGILYKIDPLEIKSVLNYLDTRELCEDSYLKSFIKQEELTILTYIANKNSQMYVNDMTDEDKAKVIKVARGRSGNNIDYYLNTIKSMRNMNIKYDLIYNIEKFLK